MQFQPVPYFINVPRPNLLPYLQANMLSLEAANNGIKSISDTVAGEITQQRAAEQQRSMQAQFQKDYAYFIENPTGENLARTIARNPWAKDIIDAGAKALSEDDKKAQLAYIQPARAALMANDIQNARIALMQQRSAYVNSGKYPKRAQDIDNILNMIDSGPDGVKSAMGHLLAREYAFSGVSDPQKFVASTAAAPFASQMAKLESEVATMKAAQEQITTNNFVDKLTTDIGLTKATALKFNADAVATVRGSQQKAEEMRTNLLLKLQEMKNQGVDVSKIPVPMLEQIAKATTAASDLSNTANKYESVAEQMESLPQGVSSGGFRTKLKEAVKQFLGEEDATSIILNNYKQLQNTGALAALRGTGSVSNFELQTFLQGWPAAEGDPRTVAAFLRATAKMSRIAAAIKDAEGSWIQQNNGSAGPATREIVIGGVPADNNMTFLEFQQKYAQSLARNLFPDDDVKRAEANGFIDETSYTIPSISTDYGSGQSVME